MKHRLCSRVLLLLVLPFLSSCSLLENRPETSRSAVETRDVPTVARSSREASPRRRLMILPFLDAPGVRSSKAGTVARDTLIRQLIKSDAVLVVSNQDFPKDLSTYVKNGEYDLEEISKIAAGMGIAAVIEGKIMELKAKRLGDAVGLVREVRAKTDATVQIRMAAAKNGRVVLTETRSASMEDVTTRFAESATSDRYLEDDPHLVEGAVTKAFYATTPRILQSLDKLSWEGRVALVKGDRIYLNAGRLSGIQVGDILKVTEEGEDVYDPETGALIGKVPGRLKGTIEVVSYFGKDGSIGVVHSGSGFRENDLVELY